MPGFNLKKSRTIPGGINAGYNHDHSFTITVTEGGLPYDLSAEDFIAELFKPGSTVPVLTLTEGAGITNNGATGILNVDYTHEQLSSIPPATYFWKFRSEGANYMEWLNAQFNLTDGRFDDDQAGNDVALEINLGDNNINLDITLGAADMDEVMHFMGSWDASGSTLPSSSVLKGDVYEITVRGDITYSGRTVSLEVGMFIMAEIDTPGQNFDDWRIIYTPTSSRSSFTGALSLCNSAGTIWSNHTQTGALAITVGSGAKVGGEDSIRIISNGSAITLDAAFTWTKVSTDSIGTSNNDVNELLFWCKSLTYDGNGAINGGVIMYGVKLNL